MSENDRTWAVIVLGLLAWGLGLWMGWYWFGTPHIPCADPLRVALPTHTATVRMISSDPKIMLVHNFLTSQECDALIAMGESDGFARSMVQGSQHNEVSTERTSHTLNFKRHQNDLIASLEQRAILFCPFDVSHVENLQIVRYQPGQQYKHHYDFFVPGAPGTPAALGRGGQRHITFFVYLNDLPADEPGGQTDFPRLNLKVRPEKGMAVLWYNVKDQREDFRTFHAGLPPERSVKYGLNIWIREREFV